MNPAKVVKKAESQKLKAESAKYAEKAFFLQLCAFSLP